MNGSEGATDSAMHDGTPIGGRHVQASRTRARNTAPESRATPSVTTGGSQTAVELARQRWGTPDPNSGLAETPGLMEPESAGTGDGHPGRLATVWADLSQMWADLADGRHEAAVRGWAWLAAYWAFGGTGFVLACVTRFLYDCAHPPARFAAFVFAAALFTAGLWLAGLI